MNRTRLWLAALACLWLLPALPAAADVPIQAIALTSCGNMGYPNGSVRTLTQTLTGELCVSGSFTASTTITGPLGRQADASSVSTALSTEDVAALKTSGTPCATVSTAGCTIGDIVAYLAQVAANPILVGPSAGVALEQATASAAVSTSSAATLQVVAASGSTVIRVTHWDLTTTLANNVTWESGDTGGSCANPVALSGAMPFAANGGASAGDGLGPILILPAGKALCMLTSAGTQISGSVAYSQH